MICNHQVVGSIPSVSSKYCSCCALTAYKKQLCNLIHTIKTKNACIFYYSYDKLKLLSKIFFLFVSQVPLTPNANLSLSFGGLAQHSSSGDMKNTDIDFEKYAKRIDTFCCNHKGGRNAYLFGFMGLKACKVVMCLDCDKLQFVGGKFGRFIYPVARKLSRGRLEVLKTIQIEPSFEETIENT